VVDDWYEQEGWALVRSRPGVKPRCTDSEVLTVELVRDLEGETHVQLLGGSDIPERHIRQGSGP